MTEAEVIQKIRHHLEGQFPKVCSVCQRSYRDLREFLRVTTPVGSTWSYDAEIGNWRPVKPLGTVTYANCPCGNTLMLSSEGMPVEQLWPLMDWARQETQRRGQTMEQLLNHLHDELCKQVLGEPCPGTAGESKRP